MENSIIIGEDSSSTPIVQIQSGYKRVLLYLAGVISLTLGVIGIFFPILPTTPFILLSASCFIKSSPKAYSWLMSHRLFGTIIYNYKMNKGLSKNVKIFTICFLWFTLMVSIFLITILWVRILLLIIGFAVTIHLLMIKTVGASN